MQQQSFKKQTTSPKEYILWYLTGVILCIYPSLLCGAVWTEECSLTKFLADFDQFIIKEHHLIVGFTKATPVFLFSFLTCFTLVFLIIVSQRKFPYAGEEYGNAQWGNAQQFTRVFADHDNSHLVEVNPGSDVTLDKPLKVNTHNYWLAEGVYLSIDNTQTANLNMLVVGPPGSGKTFRFVKPVLSNLAGNYVCTDPKGELYQQTGQYFEDNGYEVMVLNVESEDTMPMSIHFNPFRYIRNQSDVMSIAQILMKSTASEEGGGGNDQFFEQSAEMLLIAILYLIHYYYPKNMQNWKTFVMLLDATTVFTKKDGSIDNRPGGIMDIEEKANVIWKKRHNTTFPGYIDVQKYYNGAAETTSSIVASLDAHCRYMKLPCVIDLLSEDEIDIVNTFGYSRKSEQSPTGKRILYIVTSEDKRYYDWIPSMVYSLFFEYLYHLASFDTSLQGSLPFHLSLVMDEFANVTLPDAFVDHLSTMRSRNISAIMILQNLIQLKKKFPKYDMDKDLIGQCAILTVLGAPDKESCEYLSPVFGKMTIYKASESDAKDGKGSSSKSTDVMEKPLLSIDQMMSMKKDGPLAMMVKGAGPLAEPKCRLEITPFIKLLCRKKNTYDPRISLHKRRRALKQKQHGLLCGNKAKERAEELRKTGRKIIRLNEDNISDLILAAEKKKKVHCVILTTVEKQLLRENYKTFQEKYDPDNTLDLAIFMQKAESNADYLAKVCIARTLLTNGYTNQQVKEMAPLIINGATLEQLETLFKPNGSLKKIKEFVHDVITMQEHSVK